MFVTYLVHGLKGNTADIGKPIQLAKLAIHSVSDAISVKGRHPEDDVPAVTARRLCFRRYGRRMLGIGARYWTNAAFLSQSL